MSCKYPSLQKILKRIEKADDHEIHEMLKAIVSWQERKYPDYEMLVLSLPKYDYEERKRQFEMISEMIRKYTYSKTFEDSSE